MPSIHGEICWPLHCGRSRECCLSRVKHRKMHLFSFAKCHSSDHIRHHYMGIGRPDSNVLRVKLGRYRRRFLESSREPVAQCCLQHFTRSGGFWAYLAIPNLGDNRALFSIHHPTHPTPPPGTSQRECSQQHSQGFLDTASEAALPDQSLFL
jgi:hypothetical protein